MLKIHVVSSVACTSFFSTLWNSLGSDAVFTVCVSVQCPHRCTPTSLHDPEVQQLLKKSAEDSCWCWSFHQKSAHSNDSSCPQKGGEKQQLSGSRKEENSRRQERSSRPSTRFCRTSTSAPIEPRHERINSQQMTQSNLDKTEKEQRCQVISACHKQVVSTHH